MSKRFASMRETSKPSLEWALDVIKLAVPGAIMSGSFFVLAYLQSMGAPLPTADLSAMTSLFLSILVLFGAFAIGGAMVVLLPAVLCSVPGSVRQPVGAATPPREEILRAFTRRALIFDSGFYFGLLGLFVGYVVYLSREKLGFLVMLLPMGLFVLIGAGFGVWQARRARPGRAVRSAVEGAPSEIAWPEIAISSIRNAILGLFWSLIVSLPMMHLFGIDHGPLGARGDICWLSLILMIAALYAVLTSMLNQTSVVVGLVALVVLLPAFLFPRSVGAGTLRLLGAGGGLPVSVLLAPAPGIANQPALPECGCLILNAGSQVVLLPKSLAGPAPCADAQAPFSMKQGRAPTMFSKVELLPAVRVLRIGPPKSDGHDLR